MRKAIRKIEDIPVVARRLFESRAVPTGTWSLAQICEHLALAMRGSLGEFGESTVKPMRGPARFFGMLLVMRLGMVPSGVKAPDRVVPGACEWESAIAGLERVTEKCVAKLRSGEAWMRHPRFGFSDGQSWARFHVVHARHHLGFVKAKRGG